MQNGKKYFIRSVNGGTKRGNKSTLEALAPERRDVLEVG